MSYEYDTILPPWYNFRRIILILRLTEPVLTNPYETFDLTEKACRNRSEPILSYRRLHNYATYNCKRNIVQTYYKLTRANALSG